MVCPDDADVSYAHATSPRTGSHKYVVHFLSLNLRVSLYLNLLYHFSVLNGYANQCLSTCMTQS